MTKPKLYALLVGINNYPYGINSLQGCHNDVEAMEDYLVEQEDHFELHLHPPLLDKAATKANIVECFRSHFQSAEPSDTVLFYFSGHGCREVANPQLWPNEYDQLLEGLVCYNPLPWDGKDKNDTIGPNVLLVDKELRYLIAQLTHRHPLGRAPHIVIITDCCHAGDNTRKSNYGFRRVERIARQRAPEAFIFPPAWLQQSQQIDAMGASDYAEGAHVQMGACQAQQLAKETILGEKNLSHGVFTYHLLSFLRQNQGNLSYYDLHHRLKAFTRFRHEQVPQVYIPPQHQALYYQGFLNRTISGIAPSVAQMYYDDQQGWLLNKGALDSLSRRAVVQISANDGTLLKTTPIEVYPDLSMLQFTPDEMLLLTPQKTYACQIEGLLWAPLNVFLDNTAGFLNAQEVQALQQNLLQQVKGLNFVDTFGTDIYTLHVIKNEFRLSQNHNAYQPILRPLPIHPKEILSILAQYLRQIWHWNYVKNLQSEEVDQQVFRTGLPLEINIHLQLEGEQYQLQLPHARDQVRLQLPFQAKEGAYQGKSRLYIKNLSEQTLWICPLYLDCNFSVQPFLKTLSISIEPQEEVLIRENRISLKDHFLDYNWVDEVSLIKVLVSTQDDLQVEQLLITEGLPLPYPLNPKKDTRDLRDTGGFSFKEERSLKDKSAQGWMAQCLRVVIPNPEYNE